MGRKKQHTLIYLTKKKAREIRFSPASLVAGAVFSGLFLFSLILGAAYFGYRYFSPRFQATYPIRNKILMRTISELQAELNTVETYLDSMVELNNNIRLYANLPIHDLNIEKLGMGGRIQMLAAESPHKEIEALDNDIQSLSNKVYLELENYKSLYLDIQKHKDRLEYIPAITPLSSDSYYISSHYGYRTDPFTESERYHSGIDLAAKPGTPVRVSGKGTVIFAAYSLGGYGNMIKVDHGYGFVTVYAHLSKINVNKDDIVKRGDIIGHVGTTGRSTGPHLHYEVQRDGKSVNPLKFMWDDSKN